MAHVRGAVPERADRHPARRHGHLRLSRPHARSGGHHRHRAVRRAAGLLPGVPRQPRSTPLRDGGPGRACPARRPGSVDPGARRGAGRLVLLRAGDRVPAVAPADPGGQSRGREAPLTASPPSEDHRRDSARAAAAWRPAEHGLRGHDGGARARPGAVVATGMAHRVRALPRLVESVERSHAAPGSISIAWVPRSARRRWGWSPWSWSSASRGLPVSRCSCSASRSRSPSSRRRCPPLSRSRSRSASAAW